MLKTSPEQDVLLRYLSTCSDERYEELIAEAYRHYMYLPKNTGEAELQCLAERINTIEKDLEKTKSQYPSTGKIGRNNR